MTTPIAKTHIICGGKKLPVRVYPSGAVAWPMPRDAAQVLAGLDERQGRLAALQEAWLVTCRTGLRAGKLPEALRDVALAQYARVAAKRKLGRGKYSHTAPTLAARLQAWRHTRARKAVDQVLGRAEARVVLTGDRTDVRRTESLDWRKANEHKSYHYPQNIISITLSLPADWTRQVAGVGGPFRRVSGRDCLVCAVERDADGDARVQLARMGRGRNIETEWIWLGKTGKPL